MDKSKKILLIVLGVLVCVFLGIKACVKVAKHLSFDQTVTSISEAIMSADPTMNYDDAEYYTAASEGNVEASMVRDVHIEWVNGDIIVQYGPQEQITWQENFVDGEANEQNSLHYYLDEDELNLAFCAAGKHKMKNKSRWLKKDLVLTLPEGYPLHELDIDVVNGKNTLSVDARKIDIEIVNGTSYIYLPAERSFRAEYDKVNGGFSSEFAIIREGNTYTCGNPPYVEIDVEAVNGSLYINKQ